MIEISTFGGLANVSGCPVNSSSGPICFARSSTRSQVSGPAIDILALDEALQKLERQDKRKAELVRLRFFVGLSEEEAAEVLGVSTRTVSREWRFVKAWLYERMKVDGDAS